MALFGLNSPYFDLATLNFRGLNFRGSSLHGLGLHELGLRRERSLSGHFSAFFKDHNQSAKKSGESSKIRVIRPFLVLWLIVLTSGVIQAQSTAELKLSQEAEISILTVGPGTALYDRFGHSAFRVKDSINNIDWTFNYGTYDFNAPNFYGKFVRGQLLYSLSAGYFSGFINHYKKQNRSVRQQVLNLDSEQKEQLFSFLMWNAQTANKDYLYDFFYDNCATRIRDVLVSNLGDQLNYTAGFDPTPKSFRELIQAQVPYNDWGSLGMDVAIGAVVDVPATPWQFQFLPKYVAEAHAAATIESPVGPQNLIKNDELLFEPRETKAPELSFSIVLSFLTSPLLIFSILGLLLVLRSWWDYQRNKRCIYTDRAIWLITGIIGTLLLLLWFGTDHLATKMNYNLLWAAPTSLIVFALSFRQKSAPWMGQYQLFLVLMLVLMVMHQFTGVQSFAPALWPLITGLLIRFIYSRSAIKKEQ